MFGARGAKIEPPPRPEIPPLIAESYPNDADHNGISDDLEGEERQAEAMFKSAMTVEGQLAVQALLEAKVEIELIFRVPVTQEQIDAFQAIGGEITYMYKAVSYGWNGRAPLSRIKSLPQVEGASLVLVDQAHPAHCHLDVATRTGRVRPVWASGFAGNALGFDGDPSITIANIDTGVDGTHTDLASRQQYWKDFTGANAPSPIDPDGHGSHVIGIAAGTGAVSGAATGTLHYTDTGDLTSVSSGSFYPSPIGLPAASVTYTSTAM